MFISGRADILYLTSHEIFLLNFSCNYRVAVHAIISISRMKFLVRRWKKTKKSSRKAWSQDPTGALARRFTEDTRHSTEEIEKAGLSFV